MPAVNAKPLSVTHVASKQFFKRKGGKKRSGKKPGGKTPAQNKQLDLIKILCFKCNKICHFVNSCSKTNLPLCFHCNKHGHMKNFSKKESHG